MKDVIQKKPKTTHKVRRKGHISTVTESPIERKS